MQTSDYIALGALVFSAVAIVLGERRAWRARRIRSERNIVDWVVTWPSAEGFVLTSNGPDEARGVLAEVWVEEAKGEGEAKRVQRGEIVRVAMPRLSDVWNNTFWAEVEQEALGETVNVVTYSVRVTWRTPHGARQVLESSGAIQTWRPVRIQDTFF